MGRKKKDPFEEEIEWEIVSKSEMKRDMTALQKLGERVLALSKAKRAKVPLSETMLAAIREMDRIDKNEAKRRHLQYIGKVMRSEDEEGIRKALDLMDTSSEAYGRIQKQQEQWRTRLISDDKALNAFIEKFPDVDRQQLRQLVRNASKEMSTEPPKPGTHYKKLFKCIKEQYELLQDQADD